MVLFDLGRFCSFQPADLRSLADDDPLRAIGASARREALVKGQNRRSPEWTIGWGTYLYQTGSFTEAIECALHVLNPEGGPCKDQTLLAASALQCLCEFAMGKGKAAKKTLEQFETRYEGSLDLFTQAMLAYVRGSYLAGGATGEENAFLRAQPLFKTAARRFELCGKVEHSVQARIALASSLATMGSYIAAIKEIELAIDLANESKSYLYAGRLLVVGAAAASDQGYRNGVEATLLRGIEWSEFVGDFWGRVQGLYSLARLKAYQMPPGDIVASESPEKLFVETIEQAEQKGAVGIAAHATASLVWMYEKAGALERKQQVLDRETQRIGGRRPHFDGMFRNAGDVVQTVSQRVFARLKDGIETYPDGFFIFNPRKDGDHRCIDYLAEYQNERARRIVDSPFDVMFLYSEVQDNPYLRDLGEAFFEATERHVSYQDRVAVQEETGEYWYTRRIVPSGNGAILIIRDVTAQIRLQAAAASVRSDEVLEASLTRALDRAKSLAQSKLDASQVAQATEIITLLQEALDRLPG